MCVIKNDLFFQDDPDAGASSNDLSVSVDLVYINITPDEQGRFGFNVKGGIDQKMPIIVSRVGANTPADRYVPLNYSGDLNSKHSNYEI